MKKNLMIAICLFIVLAGCTHSLTIAKSPETPNYDRLNSPVSLGFLPAKGEMLDSVIQEVSYCNGIKGVTKGCDLNQYAEFDRMMDLSNSVDFKPSGQNFIITFPGFLIFAHAGFGYKYTGTIETTSKMLNDEGNIANEITILTPYEFRYTSFARGAAASSGWYIPGWGLTNIIPGLIFSSSYDERATQDFYKAAEPSYKKIIAAKILTQVKNNDYESASKTPSKIISQKLYLENEDEQYIESFDDSNLFSFYLYKIENNDLISLNHNIVKVNETEKELICMVTENEKILNQNELKTLEIIIQRSGFLLSNDFQTAKIHTHKNGRTIVLYDDNNMNIKIANSN